MIATDSIALSQIVGEPSDETDRFTVVGLSQQGAVIMKRQIAVLVGSSCLMCGLGAVAAPISGQGTWETTLLMRDINGNPVADNSGNAVFIYDTVLNVTWLRDATASGIVDWNGAMQWAANLTVGNFSDWRLPTMTPTGPQGCDFSYSGTDCGYNVPTYSGSTVYSEMATLWYDELGNIAPCSAAVSAYCVSNPQPWGLTNTGYFNGPAEGQYWASTVYTPDSSLAGYFYMLDGDQSYQGKIATGWAMAVRNGDVFAPVPEPQTLMLALLALGAAAVATHRWRKC